MAASRVDIDQDKYSQRKDDITYFFQTKKGLDAEVVSQISEMKGEPDWMRKKRLLALKLFQGRPMPTWGADLSHIDFDNLTYYMRPTEKQAQSWEELPADIRKTYELLGIPEAERRSLAGVVAQYESDAVYHSLQKSLEEKGVIFTDMDTAVQKYPDIVKEHFGTIVSLADNKFASLNSAVWSGGSFVYVPAGVHVEFPLQAYFRINAQNVGQFERTLIIVEPGAFVHYIEGCTAPIYSSSSLHAAVVEIIAREGSRVRYTTVQNWSKNIYNLVTKRAFAYQNATVEWVDGNLGSQVTMKYPAVYLMGPGARADILSIAYAGKGQHQDAGGKAVHMAPYTTSTIISKSISKDGGRTTYRGLLKVAKGAHDIKASVRCDALLLDELSRTDTIPYMDIAENRVSIGHEATVGKISDEQFFYLMSRGLKDTEAMAMIVLGFIEPFTKELPLEYAVELNRLIQLEMEGALG